MKNSLKYNFIINENMNDKLFYRSLTEELNNIIDEELSKNYEDINAELIDDCCLALSAIYELQNGEYKNSANIININNIIKKYNLQKRKKLVVSAACAAVAMFALGTTIYNIGNESTVIEGGIIKSAVGMIEKIFSVKEPATEPTTLPSVSTTTLPSTVTTTSPSAETTTQPPSISESDEMTSAQFTEPEEATTKENIRKIQDITVVAPADFNTTFTSRDEISLKDFFVSINFADGKNVVLPISEATYEICETKADGFTEIKIYYKGFSTSYYVTVIPEEKQNPVTVTSIYGIFENKYSVDDMKVFAVFSDGTEKEIPKSDCIITTEAYSDEGETGVIVNVEYENCSFQFLSEK